MNQQIKKIVIFGAGKIGRSFLGQLFSRAGYKVIFIDVNKKIINELNSKGAYKIIVKYKQDEILEIKNVCGIDISNEKAVINTIVNCDIIATCVGKNAFLKIIPLIGIGIKQRYKIKPRSPVDIILAENIRNAGQQMNETLRVVLPKSFPVNGYIGFVETSIGKMVPLIPKEIEKIDPLLVYTEPYNTLIVDKNGFKNPIPDIEGLEPKENIKAWVDHKLFLHNLGHVCAAYAGYFYYPGLTYIYEVLDYDFIKSFTCETMEQSAKILMKMYPGEFSYKELNKHIVNLINRFCNKELQDTVFRVGMDLKRKLGPNDRLIAPLKEGIKLKLPVDKIAEAVFLSLHFRAKDFEGKFFSEDTEFIGKVEKLGILNVMQELCELTQDELKIIKHQSSFYCHFRKLKK